MKRIGVTLLTALAVLAGGLAVATPAQATHGDSRACVTAKEYRAVKKGQSKSQVQRVLDGRGKTVNAKTRQYRQCGSSVKVRVVYNKNYANKSAKVVSKAQIKPAPAISASKQNALRSAKSYLEFMGFSRSGLIGQLEYEKYPTADAVWAVDQLKANWNKQAVRVAESYLDFMPFSREGLIDQLLYEGFTIGQATYAADAVGL